MPVPVGESVLERFYNEHLKGLDKGAIVPDITVVVVRVPSAIANACALPGRKIYITARALQHIYERREKDFPAIANSIWVALKYPTAVYRNIEGKRGEFLFQRIMDDEYHYACSVEIVQGVINGNDALFITTAFRNARGNYFKKCEVLWKRQQKLL